MPSQKLRPVQKSAPGLKRVNDLTNALKDEEAKLEEMKLKRDSIKGQVHH